MSVVANQYNIMAETLRRGIAGINEAKMQTAQIEMGQEQLKYGIERDRMQMRLQEEESERATKRLGFEEKRLGMEEERFGMEKELQPFRKSKAQYEGMVAQEEIRKMTTPVTMQSVEEKINAVIPAFGLTPFQKQGLFDLIAEKSGYERTSTDKGDRWVHAGSKRPVTEAEFEQNENLLLAAAFQEPGEMMTGAAEHYRNEMRNPQLPPATRNQYFQTSLKFDDLAEKIKADRLGTLEKQFQSASNAVSISKNPERWIPQLKLLAAKMTALQEAEMGGGEMYTAPFNLPNGEKQNLPVPKSPKAALNQLLNYASMGVTSAGETTESAAVRAVKQLNRGETPRLGDALALKSLIASDVFSFEENLKDREYWQQFEKVKKGEMSKEDFDKWNSGRLAERVSRYNDALSKERDTSAQAEEVNQFSGLDEQGAAKKLFNMNPDSDEFDSALEDFIKLYPNYEF